MPLPSWLVRLALGEASAVVLGGQNVVPSRLQQQLGYIFRFPDLDHALADILGAPGARRPNASAVQIRRLDRDELPGSDYTRRHRPRYVMAQATIIDAPLDEVFAFFSDAQNLGAITPPDMSFRILTPTPIAMGEGAIIDYRIKLGPLPLRWRTRIDRFERGASFADAQLRGPYRCWWHEHSFRDIGGGKTLMEDRVYYALPFGPLGWLVHALAVRDKLRAIFGYRAVAIARRFGAAASGRSHVRDAQRDAA